MISVICLNCLLAVLVCWLARLLWRWRCAISRLTHQLQSYEPNASLMPRQTGYALTRRRSQVAELRLDMALGMAQWQMRSRQISQLIQLMRVLQMTLGYSAFIRRHSSKKLKPSIDSRRNSD